ncbi:lactonase family protein [Sphingomonas glacialis]|uniref:Lactonase family protein n=1 Tax=Sphingomonas glacialis TaxID=658225 RepID=A0A502FXI4_9SPHN|nr:lactonase family protein [Sphingomonas glacialis]TPG54347.1 lactonase family protein [Sphingomonas glacialis]
MSDARPPLCVAIGTYRGGGGAGVAALCRREDGSWQLGESYADAPNASFSVYGTRHGLHYIVDEAEAGRVGVHRHADQRWSKLASVEVEGAAPCHIALDPTETLLAVANYASGSVSLLRLDPDTGLPAGAVQVSANHGSGPNPARQEAPHAHWVGFSQDGRWLYQTDLGTDEILAFAIDPAGTLQPPQRAYRAAPGSGPRHLLLHPRLAHCAYLIGELDNRLSVLDRNDASFTLRDSISTLPEGWHGESILAHVAINQACDRLYVSNRGHDSIAVFSLDDRGLPTLLGHTATGGASPRHFLLLEAARCGIVAHEKAQTVTTLAIEPDGRLKPTGVSIAVPGAAYAFCPDPAG